MIQPREEEANKRQARHPRLGAGRGHYNPIAVKALGWGKAGKKAEDLGVAAPSAKLVEARIEALRRFRWSSYGAYAGYQKAPDWLRTEEILGYVEKGTDGYRRLAESRLTEGVKEKVWTKLKWGAILGGERFVRQMRSRAMVRRETQGRASLQRQVTWPEIVEAVENVKGEKWADFVDRYGDWGCNMAFWMARRHGGLTLKEIGQSVSDMDYSAVSEALRSFARKHMPTAKVKRAMKTVVTNLSLET
ncbi:MAG: hypothetical protein U1E27_13285 [Kiritimatiellia bacterium]|nr:hypothetical protein [Kiritimatiellia bacterium]